MTEQESFVQNVIYWHPHHPHQPTDVNALHRATLKGINEQVAVFLTRTVGSMWMAYAFVLIAIIGLFSILGVLSPTIALLVAWASQTFIQLVLLPVIMVGRMFFQDMQNCNQMKHLPQRKKASPISSTLSNISLRKTQNS